MISEAVKGRRFVHTDNPSVIRFLNFGFPLEKLTRLYVRWSQIVGQFGGDVKVYSVV
jgi:hypothetical protein